MSAPATPQSTPIPADLPGVLEPVRADLDLVGEKYRAILTASKGPSGELVHHAARFSGKRLRPALTCIAARMAGREVTDDIATVAAVVELIHTATLVHDDILDNAEVRRRVSTLNARWGDQAAVLVGDILFSQAYRAAAYLDDPFASRFLADAVGHVLDGEIYQDLVSHNPDLTEEQYRDIIGGKTAALYEAALNVGAHYGGCDDSLRHQLARYGHHLGMAFQMVDDRLDLTGDEATVGKSLGTDLSEGKMTLPVILWYADRPAADRDAARQLIETAWENQDSAALLCGRLEADGALARADAAASRELEQADAALADLPDSQERRLLSTISGFVLRRTR